MDDNWLEQAARERGASRASLWLWITVWAWAALIVLLGVRRQAPLDLKIVLLLVAGAAVGVFVWLARPWLARLSFSAGAGETGGPAPIPARAQDADRIESYVKLSLHSGDFFERVLQGYLGSLALGRPLRDYEIWWRRSPAAEQAREAFGELFPEGGIPARGDRPGPKWWPAGRPVPRWWPVTWWPPRWRRPGPNLEELSRMIERMERAYELRRGAEEM